MNVTTSLHWALQVLLASSSQLQNSIYTNSAVSDRNITEEDEEIASKKTIQLTLASG